MYLYIVVIYIYIYIYIKSRTQRELSELKANLANLSREPGIGRSELTFSSVWAPRGALSLRFPVFGGLARSGHTFSNVSGPPTLSHYACAAKRTPGALD